MKTNLKRLMLIVVATLGWLSSNAYADDLDTAERALKTIAEFANSICNSISTRGSSNTLELSGDAKAEVSKLVKKLADLNIQGAAKYQSSEYEGLLQQDLAAALKDSATCKQKVFEDLKDKLLPKKAEALDPQSKDKLIATQRTCADGEFKKAQSLYEELLITFPSHPEVIRAKQECDRIATEQKEIEIGLLVSPGVFMYGEGDDSYLAKFFLHVDDSYCGSLSNRSGPDFVNCTLTPGEHTFELKRMSLYEPTRALINRGGSCGSYFVVKPSIEKYGVVLCLSESYITCNIFPVEELYNGFNHKKCKFKS